MSEQFRVRIEKERLVFSAAHFVTYDGDTCEPLHGHNYHVAAQVCGALDENHFVVDFIALRDALQQLVDQLDHRMLLPTEHPTILVAAGEKEVTVTHAQRRWVFPLQDCVLLPLANTTAELLAQHLGQRLRSVLPGEFNRLTVEVDECDGQSGIWTWEAS